MAYTPQNPNGQALMADSQPVTLASDQLVTLEGYDTANGKMVVGNLKDKFREPFDSKDASIWDYPVSDGSFLSRIEGNSAGESYLSISASALVTGGQWSMISKDTFKPPYNFTTGFSISQRINGQFITISTVGCNTSGVCEDLEEYEYIPISGTIDANNAAWVVNTTVNHKLLPGAYIYFLNNADSRANIGPVIVQTIPTATQFTVTATDHNANLTAGGFIRRISISDHARFNGGMAFWGTSANNCDAITRNSSGTSRVVAWNPGNSQTDPTIPNEGGLNYSGVAFTQVLRPKGIWTYEHQTEDFTWMTRDYDNSGTPRSNSWRNMPIPDISLDYKIRVNFFDYENKTTPVGSISAISKAGSTTATVTVSGHGLTTSDFIRIYGVRDQVGFANLTTDTVVASVVNPNQFTIAFGANTTATSYGGFVYRIQGGQTPTTQGIVVQYYAKTTDGLRLSLTGSGTWTETVGYITTLYGLVDYNSVLQSQLHGRYRVASISTSTMLLDPLDGQDLSSVSTSNISAGGTVIRNTTINLNMMRMMARARILTEYTNTTNISTKATAVTLAHTPAVTLSGTGNAVQGAVAHDSGAGGNPEQVAANARSTNYTAVADNDVARIISDLNGATMVMVGRPAQLQQLYRVVLNDGTQQNLIPQLASNRYYVQTLECANMDTTGNIMVHVKETSGGAIARTFHLRPGETVFWQHPGKAWSSSNTTWSVQASSNFAYPNASLSPNVIVSATSFIANY